MSTDHEPGRVVFELPVTWLPPCSLCKKRPAAVIAYESLGGEHAPRAALMLCEDCHGPHFADPVVYLRASGQRAWEALEELAAELSTQPKAA